MADITFSCPHCKQDIQCDELWSGHPLDCPLCHGQMTVPAKQAAPPPPPASGTPSIATAAERNNPLVPKPPAASKLSAGRTQVARSSTPTGIPQRQFQTAGRKGPNPLIKYAIIGVSVLAIAGGGYFGWTYYQDYTAKKEEEARKAELAKRAAEKAAADAAAEAARPKPPKDLPVIVPVYTTNLAEAKIPEGKVNGSIGGSTFVSEVARFVRSGNAHVLTFCQGPIMSPERAVLLFLHLKPNEGPTNQVIEVAADTKSPIVTQVMKLAKTDPRYAAKRTTSSMGYTVKLETGSMTNGLIPGKIYLSLPGEDQTVVAGVFTADVFVPDPNAVAAAQAAQPQAAVQVANPSAKAAMERRYGTGYGNNKKGR